MNSHYLASLFEPESVAIIGATERAHAIGAVLIENMLAAPYRGTLFRLALTNALLMGVVALTFLYVENARLQRAGREGFTVGSGRQAFLTDPAGNVGRMLSVSTVIVR